MTSNASVKFAGSFMYNYRLITTSNICGCFQCRKVFPSSAVFEWELDASGRQSALCPECRGCFVVGDAVGVDVTPSVLKSLHNHWFSK